ncbi:uncharacterized protein DAT39_020040 [Clarias magur]|uniref:Uncharacterized protein n=1 Tax=Clarias magur TaxID=1594786 RepID=A0A8J4WTE9_CLAMG|nr:uncharacterized protein DAT39_020040 [Clarias magur]
MSLGDEQSHREGTDDSVDIISLQANDSLYGSEGQAGEDDEDEFRSDDFEEGSPHSGILSHFESSKIIGS